jgi:catechol 2,3-dioxygenase-like lactoylglutathione lyase family enzyme
VTGSGGASILGGMLENSEAFSGFSVSDTSVARQFYEGVLGLTVVDEGMGGLISLRFVSGTRVLIYPKPNHVAATFTVVNFPVDDIDVAVDALTAAGIEMTRYEGMHQDDKGIARGKAAGWGPDQAWFTDPDGNILSVLT